MILGLLTMIASLSVLVMALGSIGHAIHAHWHQIMMALNGEIYLQPEPIRPVRSVHPVPTRAVKPFSSPVSHSGLRAAA